MNRENFTQAELAEIGAKALSNNYGGDEYEAFTGSNDICLDNNGQQSMNLVEETKGNVAFRCNIKNKLTRELVVVILPAYLISSIIAQQLLSFGSSQSKDTAGEGEYSVQKTIMTYLALNGVNADIVMLDGIWYSQTITKVEGQDVVSYNAIAEVTSTLANKTVSGFLEFVKNNPTRIPEIIVASNNVEMYTGGVMRITPMSPARNFGERTIYFNDYFDQKNNRVDFIKIPTNKFGNGGLQFDDQTLILLNIPAQMDGKEDTSVSFTFQFGVSSNKASELATKAIIAKSETPLMVKKTMVNIPAFKAQLNS